MFIDLYSTIKSTTAIIIISNGGQCFNNLISDIITWFNGDSFNSSANIWNDKIYGNPTATIIDSTDIALFNDSNITDEKYLNERPIVYGTANTKIIFPINLTGNHTLFSTS